MGHEVDAWTALQGEGAASSQEPDALHLAYADGDAVGFNIGLPLPDICLKCASEDDLTRTELRLKVKSDKAARLGRMLTGQDAGPQIANQRVRLQLPVCERCNRARRQFQRLKWLPLAVPVGFFVLLIAFAALGLEALIGPLLLLTLIAWPILFLWVYVRRGSVNIAVAGIDDEGTIRLERIHHDAAAAIVQAATGSRP